MQLARRKITSLLLCSDISLKSLCNFCSHSHQKFSAVSWRNLTHPFYSPPLHKYNNSRRFYNWRKDKDGGGPENNFTILDGKSLVDRYIFVQTLINYYEDIPSGIVLDTAYADSCPGEEYESRKPVILGLHDTPGSHHDLLPILGTFAKLGCRAVTPTFPGHGMTQGITRAHDEIFTHSTLERAFFVHDFLAELGISRVDMIVAVGAACYPALRLCTGADSSSIYRSVAFISPWPLTRPRYEVNPELVRKIQFLWERPLLRIPTSLLLPNFITGKALSKRDKVTATYLLNNLNLPEASGFALALGTLNVPRFAVFGELDTAVDRDLYYDTTDKLEIPRLNLSVYKGKADPPKFPGGLVFPEGGYDLHDKHSGIISIYLLNLLKLFFPHISI